MTHCKEPKEDEYGYKIGWSGPVLVALCGYSAERRPRPESVREAHPFFLDPDSTRLRMKREARKLRQELITEEVEVVEDTEPPRDEGTVRSDEPNS